MQKVRAGVLFARKSTLFITKIKPMGQFIHYHLFFFLLLSLENRTGCFSVWTVILSPRRSPPQETDTLSTQASSWISSSFVHWLSLFFSSSQNAVGRELQQAPQRSGHNPVPGSVSQSVHCCGSAMAVCKTNTLYTHTHTHYAVLFV